MKTVEMMKRSSICLFNDIVNSRCSTIRSRSCNTSAPEFPIQNPFGSNNGQQSNTQNIRKMIDKPAEEKESAVTMSLEDDPE